MLETVLGIKVSSLFVGHDDDDDDDNDCLRWGFSVDPPRGRMREPTNT